MQDTVVKTYRGREREAMEAFRQDAERMAANGYHPVSQTYAQGTYGCASFIFALLLCVILVGFIVFIYMLIVKPAGTLTVTYAKNSAAQVGTTKDCPQCAETVKAAAMKCRFCGFDFPADQVTQEPQQELDQAPTGASGIQAFGHDLGVLGPRSGSGTAFMRWVLCTSSASLAGRASRRDFGCSRRQPSKIEHDGQRGRGGR